jgi:excisionase family DNA binding protein
VKEAAAYLGVSEGTVRAWADAGEVPSHRTPGGHRRFREADLAAALAGNGATQVATPGAFVGRTLTRIRRRIETAPESAAHLSEGLPHRDRMRLRESGRRLVEFASDYLTKARPRSRIARDAHEVGVQYGRMFAHHGLPLSQAVEGFFFFRNLVEDSVATSFRTGAITTAQLQETHRHLTALMDQVVRGIVHGYEVPATALPAASEA